MDQPQPRVTAPAAAGAWERLLPAWDVYFAVVIGSVAIAVLLDTDRSIGSRAGAVACAAAVGLLYAVAARPRVRAGARESSNVPFVVVLLLLFAAALVCASTVGFLLFALCPLFLLVLPMRPAVVSVVVANLLPPTVALVSDGVTTPLVTHLVPMSLVSTALSAWLGFCVDRVVAQSRERAELLEQLQESTLERARLSHEAGIAAERARMAGEIHDTLAQGFTSIITLLQAAEADLHPDRGAVRDRMAMAVRTARENLAEARALVAAMSPPALGAASLEECVRRQVERCGEESGISAVHRTEGVVRPLPTAVEVVLLRAAQEALTNVRRHASARHVDVVLRYGEDCVELRVRDDGRGFEAPAAPEGFGLAGIRARARQVDGTLDVTSGASSGTTVAVVIPA